MSLWTPDGEYEVRRDQPADDQPPTGGTPGAPPFDDLSPEEREQAEALASEMAEARARLAEVPAAMVVGNHAMGLYELAAIHLSSDPPRLTEAKVAIDAMGALVDALPGRLGEHEDTLRTARSQIQMAFVELSARARDDAGEPADEEE